MTLAPLANPARLVEQVTDSLRTAIVSGSLAPGHRLSVPEVARLLGVSRTPAREAMLILERDGLIASRPRLGAQVVRYGDADLREMLDLREALDGMAARRAAERMGTAEKDALRKLLAAHEAAVAAADLERHVALDVEFHRHIRDAAGNQRLSRALLDLERQSHLLLYSTSHAPGFSGPATLRDHRAIVKAVVAGDGEAAERAARAHIHRIRAFCAALADHDGGSRPPLKRDTESLSRAPRATGSSSRKESS